MSATMLSDTACNKNVQEIMQALTNLTSTMVSGFTQVEQIEESACIDAERPQQGIAQLAYAIEQGAPEAGMPFWRLRTWGMLIWQPVSLTLLSAYHLNISLDSLDRIALQQQHNYAIGFQLPKDGAFSHHTSTDKAIQTVAPILKQLCERYAQVLNEQTQARLPLLMAVLADTLFVTLERLAYQEIVTLSVPNKAEWVYQQGQKWCQLMGLNVPKTAERLRSVTINGERFQRKTCCLIYRCHGKSECSNCPHLLAKQKRSNLAGACDSQ
ncbi:(2Fe-2S)-binding protein [Marinomonas fungiae]|uniref:(2Fe-2S)-binding protein n=1 Tax=Marinomonas fungiae TaxID=1137284 RepID=UPI003A8D82F9